MQASPLLASRGQFDAVDHEYADRTSRRFHLESELSALRVLVQKMRFLRK
jgi:hypothetical protein